MPGGAVGPAYLGPMETAQPQAFTTRAGRPRVQAIDVVRGLVMVVMALDHTRDYWGGSPVRPEDLEHTSPLLFFTRWVTHFCAPTFVLLSGMSIFLYARRQPSRAAVSGYLLSRGLWLMALEVLLLTPILNWSYQPVLLLVIWAIGGGMVLLAGLQWLPRWGLAALAVGIVAGHNLLPVIQPVTASNLGWALLHNPPFVVPVGGHLVLVAYSVGPWLGVLLAGYALGPWLLLPLPARARCLRWLGAGLLALFLLLRLSNLYGDPAPWATQPRGPLYTALSFLNVTKSPPSLLFLCVTLGGALLLLGTAETLGGQLARWLRTYGQVPFFYYLVHFSVLSASTWLFTRLTLGQPLNLGLTPSAQWPAAFHPSLLRVYVVWVLLVGLLYWPCRWYGRYKQTHRHWWLSYL